CAHLGGFEPLIRDDRILWVALFAFSTVRSRGLGERGQRTATRAHGRGSRGRGRIGDRKVAVWVLGEFSTSAALLRAAAHLQSRRSERVETYSPYPLTGASEALRLKKSRVPVLGLMGGLGGAAFGYLVQFLTNAVDWPLNVGGRPPHS